MELQRAIDNGWTKTNVERELEERRRQKQEERDRLEREELRRATTPQLEERRQRIAMYEAELQRIALLQKYDPCKSVGDASNALCGEVPD